MPTIDVATVPKVKGLGYPVINRSGAMAVYIEMGSRWPDDVTTCSDIDMMSVNADGRFLYENGEPHPAGEGR